ncbi:MAG: IS4 family transposase [Gammaproteobacteria bacterium]
MDAWLTEELSYCQFKDQRLETRFKQVVSSMNKNFGKTIPEIFNDWSEVKGAYRFLSNERVDESEILHSHFLNTQNRIEASEAPILLLHDTSEFSYKRKKPEEIGFISKKKLKSAGRDMPQHISVCGILMHASLAITQEGLPLGLTATKFWSRKVFKNTNEIKRHINPTRIPVNEKESVKWLNNLENSLFSLKNNASKVINICDREGDIYELFSKAEQLNSNFIIRACVNRLANETTIAEEMAFSSKNFNHQIDFQNTSGEKINAKIKVFVKRLIVHPPIGKSKIYSSMPITVVSAIENTNPKDRKRIRWTLLTNMKVDNKSAALKILDWYKLRWKIEEFFKILKSGFQLESSKLRTADRLAKIISISCILAWRVFWTTMMWRNSGQITTPMIVFNKIELTILKKFFSTSNPKYLSDYIILLAKLGGYLARKSDPPPGNQVIWKGYGKLNELYEGYMLAT